MSKIVVGVTGSIALYKSLDVISGLKKAGHEVKVIMTEAANMFVTPMCFATISGNKVANSFYDENEGEVVHVELGKWADYFVVCPATQNTITKIRHGLADNVLTAALSVFRGCNKDENVFIAPAMNTNMYKLTEAVGNISYIADTMEIIYPVSGELACGDIGNGKLASVDDILDLIKCKIIEDNHESIKEFVEQHR